jgi:diguanylate cyclase (GGDEF)-like protein
VKVTQTHEWCENSAESITKCLENIPSERFKNFCQELLQNRDVVVRRLNDLPQDSIEVQHYQKFGFRSMICVPLLSDGAVYGAMVAFSRRKEERNWSEEDVSLLRVVSGILSNAMERKRAEEAEREQRRLAEALRDTANALNSTLDIDEVLDNILVNVGRVVPHDSSNIMILEGDYVKIVRSWGYETPEKQEYIRHFYCRVNDMTTLQKMSENLQPILVSDADHSANWTQSQESSWIKSYAGAPVCIQEHLIGFINLNSSQPGFFQDEHLERLQAFANQAAIAIQNSQLYVQVQTMSITDSLTGLYNRRGLFNLGEREVDRSRRFDRPLSALFIDIDHFKRVNDSFSHSVGDEVLCTAAERFRSVVRSVDIIGRYGGEEFVILLPEVELEGALQVGERLRQVIANAAIHLSTGEISITISVGVAQFTPVMQELSVLLHLADEAMYLAKQAGRNQVVAAD